MERESVSWDPKTLQVKHLEGTQNLNTAVQRKIVGRKYSVLVQLMEKSFPLVVYE